jgi:tryptophan-rich sensory protein
MNEYTQYADLIKPSWAPPAFLFGPVWTVLYTIIAISFGYVFYLVWKNIIPRKVALPFVLNLGFNALFTPLQFGLNNNLLASIDIVLVLITLVWLMRVIWPFHKWVALVNIPYLLWVSFATALQITITFLN